VKPTGQRDGVEWRTDKRGHRAYRGVLNTAASGKQRGGWGSRAAAKGWRSKALGEAAAGSRRRSTITLADAAADFIAGLKAGAIVTRAGHPYRPNTIRGYDRDLAKVAAELGPHKLAEIRRADVQALVDGWSAAGWGPSSIRNGLDPLRTIYRRALARDQVAVNPCAGVQVPASPASPMRIVSKSEASAMLAALPAGQRALWACALYAGLRRGELQALRWKDVDLSAGLIRVSRGWDQHAGPQLPKTRAGERNVPIVPPLAALLHRGDDDALVFGRTAGQPFTPSTVRARANAAWAAAGLAPIALHQARHCFASMMIDSGANPKALSVVLGHTSVTLTFDLYGHLMPGGEAEVGRLLAVWLERP
jgi:integrase